MHTSYLSLAVFALGVVAAPSFPKPNGDPFAGAFPFIDSGSSAVSDDDGLSNPVPAYMAAMQAVEAAQAGGYNIPQPTHNVVAKPHKQSHAAPAPKPKPQPPAHKPQLAEPAPMADPVESNPVPADDIPAIPSAPVAPPPKPSSHAPKPSIASSAMDEAMSQVPAEATPEPTFDAPVTVTPIMPTHAVMQTPKPSMVPSSFATHPHVFSTMASPSPTHRPMHSMNIHEGHISSSKLHATPSSSATPSASASASATPKAGLLGLGDMVGGLPLVGGLLGPMLGA